MPAAEDWCWWAVVVVLAAAQQQQPADSSDGSAAAARVSCLGEFQLCPATGECTLFACNVSSPCPSGHYRCPLSEHCVAGPEQYTGCPGLAGTHLDHTLPVDQRLDKLVGAATLSEQISQLTNAAPAIERLGIPGYQWLNDDVHGVMSSGTTTSFPDGPGLGATWDKELLGMVGRAQGMEGRAVHNNQTGSVRPTGVNGRGITMYGPNMNVVRDPRCK
jgi:beta-glucosidase